MFWDACVMQMAALASVKDYERVKREHQRAYRGCKSAYMGKPLPPRPPPPPPPPVKLIVPGRCGGCGSSEWVPRGRQTVCSYCRRAA